VDNDMAQFEMSTNDNSVDNLQRGDGSESS
jgi:hypothetical protein